MFNKFVEVSQIRWTCPNHFTPDFLTYSIFSNSICITATSGLCIKLFETTQLSVPYIIVGLKIYRRVFQLVSLLSSGLLNICDLSCAITLFPSILLCSTPFIKFAILKNIQPKYLNSGTCSIGSIHLPLYSNTHELYIPEFCFHNI